MPTLFQALPSDYNSQDYSPLEEGERAPSDKPKRVVEFFADGSNGLELHLYPKVEVYESVDYVRIEGTANTAKEQRKVIDIIYNTGLLQQDRMFRWMVRPGELDRLVEIMNNPTPENRAERYARTFNMVEAYKEALKR